jgi:hypothetical protein
MFLEGEGVDLRENKKMGKISPQLLTGTFGYFQLTVNTERSCSLRNIYP